MGTANNSFSVPAGAAAVVNQISQIVDMVTVRVQIRWAGGRSLPISLPANSSLGIVRGFLFEQKTRLRNPIRKHRHFAVFLA
jgi:hypothetical protein